jgi:hypothetical protein
MRKMSLIGLICFMGLILVGYQNCGPGFEVSQSLMESDHSDDTFQEFEEDEPSDEESTPDESPKPDPPNINQPCYGECLELRNNESTCRLRCSSEEACYKTCRAGGGNFSVCQSQCDGGQSSCYGSCRLSGLSANVCNQDCNGGLACFDELRYALKRNLGSAARDCNLVDVPGTEDDCYLDCRLNQQGSSVNSCSNLCRGGDTCFVDCSATGLDYLSCSTQCEGGGDFCYSSCLLDGRSPTECAGRCRGGLACYNDCRNIGNSISVCADRCGAPPGLPPELR